MSKDPTSWTYVCPRIQYVGRRCVQGSNRLDRCVSKGSNRLDVCVSKNPTRWTDVFPRIQLVGSLSVKGSNNVDPCVSKDPTSWIPVCVSLSIRICHPSPSKTSNTRTKLERCQQPVATGISLARGTFWKHLDSFRYLGSQLIQRLCLYHRIQLHH